VTRPRGTGAAKLRRSTALELAEWLARYKPLEPTILGTVGMTPEQVQAGIDRDAATIDGLRSVLAGATTGRPRAFLSTYWLPVEGLRLIQSGWAMAHMSKRHRMIWKSIFDRMKRKPGPKPNAARREKCIANGGYAPETIRRYRWQAKVEAKAAALTAAREACAKAEAEASGWRPPKPGTEAFAVLAVMAAGHRIV